MDRDAARDPEPFVARPSTGAWPWRATRGPRPVEDDATVILGLEARVHELERRNESFRRAYDGLAGECERLGALTAAAVAEERARVARDIHDTLAQCLVATIRQLEVAGDRLHTDPESARARLVRAHELAREALAEARRAVWALRPPCLEGGDLFGAITQVARSLAQGGQTEVESTCHGVPRTLPSDVEENLLRVGQEAVNNALEHARAGRVHIALTYRAGAVEFSVEDDGEGFETGTDEAGRGVGLQSMRERAERIGGRLHLVSELGRGTLVTVVVPVDGTEGAPHGRGQTADGTPGG
jgi:signal transduction histidine kinase